MVDKEFEDGDDSFIVEPSKEVASKPWAPASITSSQAYAIQALSRGDASSEQQREALKWIVNDLSKRDDMSYRPDSQRDSDFAEGKRYVGNQLVKLTKINLALYKENKDGR